MRERIEQLRQDAEALNKRCDETLAEITVENAHKFREDIASIRATIDQIEEKLENFGKK
jgi:phage shock protein A